MPRRNRDYRAEEARRNELAKQRGFTTRAAERGAKTRADWQKAGYSSHAEYVAARRRAQQWSAKHSAKTVSEFKPTFSAQQVAAYPFVELEDKNTRHQAYMKKLAVYLHSIAPEVYPSYDQDRAYWDTY
jgi:hypothetical protein